MVDFLGKELHVGDKVVGLVHRRTSSTLYLGKVIRITNKMIEVETSSSNDDWRYDKYMRVSPNKVVMVNLADDNETDQMSDLIDRDELLDALLEQELYKEYIPNWAYTVILDMPAVDADPVVHGRWIPSPLGNWCCSECKTEGSPRWMRCPVCEAKMDLEVDHDGHTVKWEAGEVHLRNTACHYADLLQRWEDDAYNGGYGSDWLEEAGEGIKFYAMECAAKKTTPTFKGLILHIAKETMNNDNSCSYGERKDG